MTKVLSGVQAAARVATDDATLWTLIPTTPVLAGGQRQGDLRVEPWPETTAAGRRSSEVRAARILPTAGLWVLPRHRLLTLTGCVFWHPYLLPGSQTLGLLKVMPRSVAVLSHPEHPDLHVGPGVYVLRRQRRWSPVAPEYVED
jgi:hypothetical protein